MLTLIQHIKKITGNKEFNEADILSLFEIQKFKKKEILHEEGHRCNFYFFIVKGCLRLYIHDTNGSEQTQQFALENWWLTDLTAFRSGRNSACTIQAVEETEVLAITSANYELLLKEVPIMESYFRLIYERAYAATLLRVQMISRMPKEEFYDLFQSRHPEFVQRVPQKMLASFLGFSPEYLSELGDSDERDHSNPAQADHPFRAKLTT